MSAERQDAPEQLEEAAVRILQESKRHPVPLKKLQKEIARKVDACRTGRIFSTLETLVDRGMAMGFGEGASREYYLAANLDQLQVRLCAILRSFHAKYPYEAGMSTGEIRRHFSETKTLNANRNIDARLFELAVSACKRDGLVAEADCGIRLSDFTPRSKEDEAYRRMEQDVLAYVRRELCARFDFEELARQLGVDSRQAKAVAGGLIRTGRLIEIERDCFAVPSDVVHARSVLAAEFSNRPRLRAGEITALLGHSRRTTLPLLEYFDKVGFTRRDGDYRQLAQPVVGGASVPSEDSVDRAT